MNVLYARRLFVVFAGIYWIVAISSFGLFRLLRTLMLPSTNQFAGAFSIKDPPPLHFVPLSHAGPLFLYCTLRYAFGSDSTQRRDLNGSRRDQKRNSGMLQAASARQWFSRQIIIGRLIRQRNYDLPLGHLLHHANRLPTSGHLGRKVSTVDRPASKVRDRVSCENAVKKRISRAIAQSNLGIWSPRSA